MLTPSKPWYMSQTIAGGKTHCVMQRLCSSGGWITVASKSKCVRITINGKLQRKSWNKVCFKAPMMWKNSSNEITHIWKCTETCNLCTLPQRAEINIYMTALYSFRAAIRLDVYPQSLWWLIHNMLLITVHVFHTDRVCAQFIWKTPVTRQIRQIHCKWKQKSAISSSDLIHRLSSDSMRSHPEIAHEPHLLSIWPCSHAIQYATAARPALQRQRGSAVRGFYGEKWVRVREKH